MDREFKVGDVVWLASSLIAKSSVHSRASTKLFPKYFGPFEVLAKVGAVSYKLKLPEGSLFIPFSMCLVLRKLLETFICQLLRWSSIHFWWPHWSATWSNFERKVITQDLKLIWEGLTKWSGQDEADAIWEKFQELRLRSQMQTLRPRSMLKG